jgi:hypothetical protein
MNMSHYMTCKPFRFCSPSLMLISIDHVRSLTSLKAHIEKKYVEGMWLDERDRAYYFDDEPGIAL